MTSYRNQNHRALPFFELLRLQQENERTNKHHNNHPIVLNQNKLLNYSFRSQIEFQHMGTLEYNNFTEKVSESFRKSSVIGDHHSNNSISINPLTKLEIHEITEVYDQNCHLLNFHWTKKAAASCAGRSCRVQIGDRRQARRERVADK